ncbi:MAG: ATP-binding cassette domain-containing protein [Candidatus Lokiarchaeota archaeon]|nr:ATP-binding cassette domain-containing protein [Candidatus Lokiarchaeota archaeon]
MKMLCSESIFNTKYITLIMSDREEILRVEGLKAFYATPRGLLKAVNDISFTIYKGESVGIFGESGAGKSSIALAIMGVFNKQAKMFVAARGNDEMKRLWSLKEKALKKKLTSKDMGEELPGVEGHIWFKGEDLLALDEKEYRKIRGNEITYVPQASRTSMNPYTEIDIQTAEALWAHDEDDILWEKEVLRRVLIALDLVEIADVDIRRKLKPSEFSMGEDQRILIAMALIMNPVLMIADEPTTAVDVGVQKRVMEAIQLVRDKLELAMLLISNDQGLIAQTTDKVGVMSAGHLLEFGDTLTVMKRPGHPFTRAFIMSNPPMHLIRKIREKGLKIRGIPGKVPDMVELPSGCPFHPRCEYVVEKCREIKPDYREVEKGHWVMCHRFEELPEFEL